jgi:mRNA interferase YafQ
MRDIVETSRFQKDLKRQKKRGSDLEKLADIVEILAATGALPRQFKPHPLTGEWKGVWDCHIEPDWLLLYDVSDTEVTLFRTGTHSDLFD